MTEKPWHARLDGVVAACDSMGRRFDAICASRADAAAPFVTDLLRRFKSASGARGYIDGLPKEKLDTAYRLLKGRSDPDDRKVRKIIERELDDRACRGS